jgi:multicomponent Na+:H+ antiporter subunit C
VILLLAATVGTLFGSGAYLMLKPDLLRIVAGLVLVSNAAILALLAAALDRGRAPILPLGDGAVSDPVVQALALTGIVIGLAVAALLFVLAYQVYATSETIDLDELSQLETRREQELEQEEVSV